MKKIAYPWIDNHDQSSDLSDHPMDDIIQKKDITTSWYDTFSLTPDGGDLNNLQPVTTYSEGIISPVNELEGLLTSLGKNSSNAGLLTIGMPNLASELKASGYNIVSFSSEEEIIDEGYITKTSGDIRFYNFDRKFDVIFVNRKRLKSKIAYDNILDHLSSHSYLIDISGKAYLKDTREKESLAHIGLRNGNTLLFRCDIAENINDKVIGLQSYASLPSDFGLLFKYGEPTDVTFHMGTVSYPIDIIFVGQNGIIKKISKNIHPGDLGLYSCSNVSSVLEISGGLSEELGIRCGDIVHNEKSNNSHMSLGSMRNVKGFVGKGREGSLEKYASYRMMLEKNNSLDDNASIFCLDKQIFSKNSFIKFYAGRPVNKDDTKVYRDVNNCTFATDDIPISVSMSSFGSSKILNKYGGRLAIGPGQSMDKLIIGNNVLKNIDSELKKNNKVVIATSSNIDKRELEFILHSKLANEFPGTSYKNKIIAMQIPEDFDDYEIICAAKSKFLLNNAKLFNENVIKTAGVPVPEQTKKKAQTARKFFVRAEESMQEILNDLNHNKVEYEKFAGDAVAVKNSKGEFNRSSKRISKKVKSTLLQIRDGIRILNSIKDVSSTVEMIDRLTVGAKEYSSHINNIFELINIIDTPNFVAEHTVNVDKTVALGGDLSSSLIRAKNYIDSNILGITILSE